MIRELQVRNLALIEDVTVEFSTGFSIFTGETGAGKSILIGAIGLLLGDRASAEMVRAGFEEADVRGTFELPTVDGPLKAALDAADVSAGDGTLIIRRRISTTGKNRIYINDAPVTLATLSAVGDLLVDFHSQHEHQSLLDPQTPYDIIDALPEVGPARAGYAVAFNELTRAQQELAEHDRHAAELTQRREFLEFQYNELSSLGLREGEEEELERELTLLSTVMQRAACVHEIRALLSEGDAPLQTQIAAVRKRLEQLAKFDSTASAWLPDIAQASSVFGELERFCASYAERLGTDSDPARIDDINARLAKIQRLKKKHGCSLPELVAKTAALRSDLDRLANIQADRAELAKRLAASRTACLEKGKALSCARAKAAQPFDRRITAQMSVLGFEDGQWQTSLTPIAEPQPHGLESVGFLVRTNPGEPLMPLAEIASGGEISRLMLAVKSVIAAHDRVPVLIFDEVDSGVGGVIAKEVGAALQSLSATHQVICITHLHQIASQAAHHYRVYKETTGGRTVTRVKKLSDAEKVSELARMLGGESDIARRHARELLRRRER